MAKELIFPVAKLLKKEQGEVEIHKIDVKPRFETDFVLSTNIKAEILLLSLPDEIHVEIRGLTTSIRQTCSRCAKKYTQKIKIPLIGAEFLLDPPAHMEDQEDFFPIDKKELTIDLTEVLRQEILLHFPLIPVCSKSCLGLCIVCGTDLNKQKCSCKKKDEGDKPLAILKQFK